MESLLESTRKHLSEFEAKILGYYLEGLSCHEIAKAVGKSPKSVDNAVQRVRRKAAQHIFPAISANAERIYFSDSKRG